MKIFKFLSIFLIFVFIFLTPTFIQKFIKITKIECQTQFGKCNKEFQKGDYIFVKKQINEKLSNDITVIDYSYKFKLPSTIKINMNIKVPKYAIKDSTNRYFLIDREGTVIDVQSESSVITLNINDANYNLSDKISENLLFSFKLFDKINWLYPVDTALLDTDFIKINLKQGKIIYLPTEGDIDLLSSSLRLIFSRLNDGTEGIRMEDVREIDLRFKNVVLR